jgi:ubiquinone/menaquinone biosynthesis C-methylase UbiE
MSGKEIYLMQEINGKKFYTIYEISYLLKKELTPDEIKLRIENEELLGQKIDHEWHMNEETVNFLVDVMINHKIDCSRIFDIKEQKVNLSHIRLEGLVLDIGGGGEGVIGQFKKDQVIAIDHNKRELEEAPEGGVKIIMDAGELKFLDNTFDTVTSFFTLMYIPKSEHKKIFKEIYRVLKKDGHFVLWDVIIPKRENQVHVMFSLPLKIKIDDKELDTGYGVFWGKKEQNLEYFQKLSIKVGFSKVKFKSDDQIFYLRVKK